MNIDSFFKLIALLTGFSGLLLILLLALRLYLIRKDNYQKEVELGEAKIDAHIESLDDNGLVNELNELESARRDTTKKE